MLENYQHLHKVKPTKLKSILQAFYAISQEMDRVYTGFIMGKIIHSFQEIPTISQITMQ